MSRSLPQFPNLDHLRKQAKILLRQLKQTNPQAQLSQAQHEIARQYGFASWAKLKAHVESNPFPTDETPATQPAILHAGGGGGSAVTSATGDAGGLFPRFTEKARQTIFFARYLAGQGTRRIETDHLLMAVILADGDLVSHIVPDPSLGEKIRTTVEHRAPTREEPPANPNERLSPECRRVLQFAGEEADRLHHDKISAGHFLLGLLDDEGSRRPVLVELLRQEGMNLDAARAQIVHLLEKECA